MKKTLAVFTLLALSTAAFVPTASARTVIIEHGRHHHPHFYHHHHRTVIIRR